MLPSILTIYTTGDALFLQNVLNAVAMVTGTGSFVTASVIGMLVGIVLMGFKSVQTGKGFDLSSIVICIIAWNFFFGSTVKVNVHDVITEEDRPVDNVPAGVGVAGWAISNIAYGLTQIMEQAFQSPYSTTTITGGIAGNGGLFNDVTKTLNTISKIGMYPQIIQAINKDNGTKSDFRASATNFVKDCTFTAYALGYKTSSDIQNNSVSVKNTGTGDSGALDFPEANGVYFTHIKLGNSPEGVTIGCEQAWDRLDNALDVSFDNSESYFNKNLTSLLFPSEKFNENGTGNYTKGIDKATDIMSYATRGTYGVQEFMKAAIMYDLFSAGAIAVARDSNDVATAMMLAQARRQRNMQWSSEGTMFQKTMRPIMTFMEGFTYAITPFCGFLILMGMFGLKLSLKYFMLVAWVQSWLPCIAIANSYLNTTMQRAILSFAGAGNYKGYNFDSLHGVKILADTTEDFIATGGMFLGAIPVITLFIFSGSVYALNSLATRMNGQDFINEKIATPDIINPAAVVTGMSQMNSQFGVGAQIRSNWETLSFQYSDLSSVIASRNRALSWQNSTNASSALSVSNAFSLAQQDGIGKAWEDSSNSLSSESLGFLKSLGQEYATAWNQNHSASEQKNISASGAISLGASILSAGIRADNTLTDSYANAIGKSGANKINDLLQKSEALTAAESVSAALSENQSIQNAYNQVGGDGKSFVKTFNTMKSNQESYAKNYQAAISSTFTKSVTIPQALRDLKQYGGTQRIMDLYNEQIQNNPYLREQTESTFRTLDQRGVFAGASGNEAMAIAAMKTLSEVSGEQGNFNRYAIANILEGRKVEKPDFSLSNAGSSVNIADETNRQIENHKNAVNSGISALNKATSEAQSLTESKIKDDHSFEKDNVGLLADMEKNKQKEERIATYDKEVLGKRSEILSNAEQIANEPDLSLASNSVFKAMDANFNIVSNPLTRKDYDEIISNSARNALNPLMGSLGEGGVNDEAVKEFGDLATVHFTEAYKGSMGGRRGYTISEKEQSARDHFMKTTGMSERDCNTLMSNLDYYANNSGVSDSGINVVANMKGIIDLSCANKRKGK